MKHYFVIFFLIVTTTSFSQNDSAAWYHPLHIGNDWIYQSSVSLFSRKIIGDTLLNGIPYVIVKEIDHKTNKISYVYERYDTLSRAFYSLRSTTEDMLDSVSVTTPNKLFNGNLMRFISAVPETIFGMSTISRTTQMNPVGVIREWKFSHGMGLTKELEADLIWGTGGAITLAYAKINGKEFGVNPLSVETERNTIPTTFSLSQNYPNPFNPLTTITYRLPSRNIISLKIFSVIGKEVTTLVEKQQDAGTYSVQFNASSLASGIYFYRLQADNFNTTMKMILLK